jgi:hypothetical protein
MGDIVSGIEPVEEDESQPDYQVPYFSNLLFMRLVIHGFSIFLT